MIDKAQAQAVLAAMFQEAAALTQAQVIITGGGGEGEAPIIWMVPDAIITRIPADRVDGTTVLPNDELMRVRVAALPLNVQLKPGDTFNGTSDGLQRNVVTAHLDALGILWTCAVRRVL